MERTAAVEQALLVGATTLEFAETSKDLEFVKSEFSGLQSEFEEELEEFEAEVESVRDELDEKLGEEGSLERYLRRHFGEDGKLERRIEKAFGEDGAFQECLDRELGEDGERIRQALDPNKEDSPTHQLKQRLVEEIREVKDELVAEEGREEIRQESWHKGEEFEDQVGEILEDIVRQTPNDVEDTSERTGQLQDSKKGDFVVHLEDTDQRIVVEAKHGHFNNTVEDEMAEAIENRDADFGILVAESIAYLPETKVGWFSEIDRQYVVVALSDEDDEEIEPRFLKFAFHWARTRSLLSAFDTGEEVDTETVRNELEGIENSIEEFSNIRRDCTNIEQSLGSIRETLGEVEQDINSRLGKVQGELIAGDGD